MSQKSAKIWQNFLVLLISFVGQIRVLSGEPRHLGGLDERQRRALAALVRAAASEHHLGLPA